MVNKAKIFVFDAGKVIMIISLDPLGIEFFWTRNRMKEVAQQYEQLKQQPDANDEQLIKNIASANWKILMQVFWENQLSRLLIRWVMIGRLALH